MVRILFARKQVVTETFIEVFIRLNIYLFISTSAFEYTLLVIAGCYSKMLKGFMDEIKVEGYRYVNT